MFSAHGGLFFYGDAEAHWDIARRIVDSRTPGYDQIGTVWLPLPHLLLAPLAAIDTWWRNGLAAALPSALSFVVAGGFLFSAVRRIFDSAAAAASTAVFAGNPNLLYLQSTAMTEAIFFACLMALLYFTIRFQETQGWGAVAGAGVACCLGALTRYEAWFLIPFVAAYFLFQATRKRWAVAALFGILATLGPAYWLAHNWWLSGDLLEFYRGPYSAIAIQGPATYPGRGNWALSWLYFRTAAELCAGAGLWWIGLAGIAATLVKRVFWPVALFALPALFYVWSMHSAATPIFVPTLWPNTYYNTRYGLAALPLLSLAAAGLVALSPRRAHVAAAVVVAAAGVGYWALHSSPEQWVAWKESRVNSEGRRTWVRETAEYLAPRYDRGSGILSASGEFRAVYRELGIPLRESLSNDNGLLWLATVRRPEIFLWQEWALAIGGDAVEQSVERARSYGIRYRLEKTIPIKDSPAIEIYRRIGGRHGSA
ncbi:MAG: glycosyltransferase family 39 protein [Acidobacteriia bacterium]|nr:glycosyltransferase family 39 protein [Terriglobia bacterium]